MVGSFFRVPQLTRRRVIIPLHQARLAVCLSPSRNITYTARESFAALLDENAAGQGPCHIKCESTGHLGPEVGRREYIIPSSLVSPFLSPVLVFSHHQYFVGCIQFNTNESLLQHPLSCFNSNERIPWLLLVVTYCPSIRKVRFSLSA